ncbi:MAG TPA: HAMP domain-containing sensor histidine kinase [Spirochaetia bacterium]|nr:HAMP domain-containing sensor histidine kinase [Spirochaetales bacterium]HRY79475.1 HAMP domain-containing sensor histidine kinase [Spirochaetia bacterium]
MGLKARLLLLMTGIAVLPVLSSALLILYLRTQYPGFAALDSSPLELGIRQMETRLAEALEEGDLERFLRGSENLSIRVEESDTGRIVFERAVPAGGPGADELAIRFSAGGRGYRAVFRSDSPPDELGPSLILPLLPVAVLGIVILFTVAVSFGILRSLGRSMGKLEEATRRIAAGDLDFEPALPAGDSLASLAASMDAMRLRLKEEYQRRDRFILAVSHDLKTPLAVLEGYLDAFADGLADSPEKRESYLKVLREKTGVLAHRISHLVELARMTTVEWRQTFEDCDLSAFLEETLGLLADEAAARGRRMEVDFRLSPGLRAALNRDMARRVLENLADNAETYSPPDSVLRASAREEGAEVLVRISNEGEGIPAERRGLVFEPFYRGNPGRNAGGFGLGLASVKSIAEAHGWGIDLESVPGGTTTFTVRIPAPRS